MRTDTMCHHSESMPEWEALAAKELQGDAEESDADGDEILTNADG